MDGLNKYIIVLLLSSFIFPFLGNANSEPQPIGINLSSVRDWSTELVFNDMFKRARSWVNGHAKRGFSQVTIKTDENGWVKELAPNQVAITYVLMGFKKHFPSVNYRCVFDGEGEITFPGTVVVARSKGELEVQLKSNVTTLELRVIKTNPNNYIRNIRIFPINEIGEISKGTFARGFLDHWKEFQSVRFMDWMATNNSKQMKWTDRPTKKYFSQATKKGVALEYMIELANTLKISPWFCMPEMASNKYVRNFVETVKEQLDPSLNVYIEYSNEVWNGAFSAHRYAEKMGMQLGLSREKRTASLRYYTHRSLQIFKIWEDEFGGASRLIRVLSSQAVVLRKGEEILDWEDAYKKVDALAIAPYIGFMTSRVFNQRAELPASKEVFKFMEEEIDQSTILLSKYKRLIDEKNVRLIAYEGGQHLTSFRNKSINLLYNKMNRSPEMYSLYKQYLKHWFQYGGGLFMAYSSVGKYGKYGSWGLLEWYDQSIESTKYQAVRDVLNGYQ